MNIFLDNPGLFGLVLVFAASLAILAGYGIYKMTRSRGDESAQKAEEDKTDVVSSHAVKDEASPKEKEPPKPRSKPPVKHWDEVAHLWRDSRDGRLIFQIGDQHYKRGSDLTPKERKILLKVVMDFYRWLEPPAPAQPKPAETTPGGASTEPVSPVPSVAGTTPEPPQRISPTTIIANALQSAVPAPPVKTPSIVMQIDAILQEKQKAAGMQKWAIRLVEFPNRGMVVLVGLEQYDSIDEVPYKAVRQLIRASVAEWEEQVAERTSENG